MSRLRIAYGVMGYGRGHATRVRSVLPALLARHDVTVFAGGDAVPVLAPLAPVVKIPTLGYVYGHRGTLSVAGTLSRNFAGMSDLLLGGTGLGAVARELRDGAYDVVISDSEAWTHRAAAALGIPRISFDHVGIIAWCKPHFPSELWLRGMRDGLVYRRLMGNPDRILITSFYGAEGAQPGTHVIGPVLREELQGIVPTPGGFLFAYLNKGRHQYTAALDLALRRLDAPVVIYGTPYRGRVDNLEFRAPSNHDFNLEAQRATAVLNNDDYYEIHKDGRIYVLADAGDVREFLGNGEIPLRLTRIGGGPKGETIVFGIARPESKKKDGFGAVEMYDFKREGSAKGFYAEVARDNRYYLFGDWARLAAFRKSGSDAGLSATAAQGPNGEAVLVAGDATPLLERFKTLHGG